MNPTTLRQYIVKLHGAGVQFLPDTRRTGYALVQDKEATKFPSYFAAYGRARDFRMLPINFTVKRAGKIKKPKSDFSTAKYAKYANTERRDHRR
jgi:hypothetical protein